MDSHRMDSNTGRHSPPVRPLLARLFPLLLLFSLLLSVGIMPVAAESSEQDVAHEAGVRNSTGVHTTYLWHMHQPIYWPDRSTWTPQRYETAYETITLGHSLNSVFEIFDKDDRVGDYQHYPKDAVASILQHPEAGAQISFAGALIENLFSLGDNHWNGGRYAVNWYSHYRTARSWLNSAGERRLDLVQVGAHHAIAPLMDDKAFRMELAVQAALQEQAWGAGEISRGFFPAEMCFSERLIPALSEAGIEWSIVGDVHLARACADYPYLAHEDNCDPPNRADQLNPDQGDYTHHFIPRGVTVKVPYPFGFTPHRAEYIDPATGQAHRITVIPAANAMGWDEGYGLYGTGDIDTIAHANNPDRPMLILFAHDGDNAWSGGYSYYYDNVSQFCDQASQAGYTPTTIETYLQDHPVPEDDVVHVEDGGWVNADGDFGSPQFINWNWPLVDPQGRFDIPGGWAEDERNWAVLTAMQNRVETAAAIQGAVDPARVADPLSGANPAEEAWHFLLAGYESGYMYYGAALDMEVKATLACNAAANAADPVIAAGADQVPPTVWLPQRLPWNPGGYGGGSLWGYPGGQGAPMDTAFHVWTFAYDVSGLSRVELKVRVDLDGVNNPLTHDNETYAGGPDVGTWSALPMNQRTFPLDEPWPLPDIDFFVLPLYIADQYWVEVAGFSDVLLDYYIEAEDNLGQIKRTPIQHVYVGTSHGGGGGSDRVWWIPEEPQAGGSLAIFYDPAGSILEGADPILIHLGFDGWQGVQDHAMTWEEGDSAWVYEFTTPGDAHTVDFVFHDGMGTWDNNGGADWEIVLQGSVPSPFVMDGELDLSAELWAQGDGLRLWGSVQDGYLYLATEPTDPGLDRDHFLFVCSSDQQSSGAPWAKSGSVLSWDRFLAAEEQNGWYGWFDGGGQVVTGPAHLCAQGSVLEGSLSLNSVYGGSPPGILWSAAAAFGTADGGALTGQAPSGDGDGDLESGEYYRVEQPGSGADGSGREESAGIVLAPNPTRGGAEIRLQGLPSRPARITIHDASGRRVASLDLPPDPAAPAQVLWGGLDDRGRPVPAGVYLVRAGGGLWSVSTKLLVIK